MLTDDILSTSLARIGQRQDDTDLQLQGLNELVLIQEELNKRAPLPWFLNSAETSLLTVIGSRVVPYPATYLAPLEGAPLRSYINDIYSPPLYKASYEELVSLLQGTGKPLGYFLDTLGFSIFPIPDKIYTLKFRFNIIPKTPALGVETEWGLNEASLLIALLSFRLASVYTQDTTLMPILKNEVARALHALEVEEVNRSEVNTDIGMGDRHGY